MAKQVKYRIQIETNQVQIEFAEPVSFAQKECGLAFENCDLRITDYHEQDCCENVYADLDGFHENYLGPEKITGINFLTGVDESGVMVEVRVAPMEFELETLTQEGFFYRQLIPCYDIQNGYYSSDLVLLFKSKGKLLALEDISSQCEFIEC